MINPGKIFKLFTNYDKDLLHSFICSLLSHWANGQPSFKEEVTKLHQAYCHAIETGDSVFIETLFHNDLVITSASGARRNKKEELQDLFYPGYKVNYFRSEGTEVRIYEDVAIVLGDLVWSGTYQGKSSENKRRFTFTYKKFRTGWKIIAQQVGMVPKE